MKRNLTFGKFMAEVASRADNISFEKTSRPLSDKYGAPSIVLNMIGSSCRSGWANFSVLADIVMKNSYSAFAKALATFQSSAAGTIMASSLAYWGGHAAIKLLYNHRYLTEDIRDVGIRYEKAFCECESDSDRDTLAYRAAEELYNLR